MKKRLALTLTVIFVLLLAFAGCKKSEAGGAQGGANNSQGAGGSFDGLAVVEGMSFNILIDNGEELNWELVEAIADKTGVYPTIREGSGEQRENELLFGYVDRKVSDDGYTLLRRLKVESTQHQPYLVYSDGEDIAFCYDGYVLDNKYVIEYVADRFYDEYVVTGKKIEAGVLFSGTLNAVEFQEKKDELTIEAAWQRLYNEAGGGAFGEETVTAIKSLYELYSDRAVEWLADLYDPDTGGFYYSNSGRNSEGFLPDIESTAQALIFLTGTGMTDSVENLPEDMKEKIVAFTKSRQNPDGYFYHPQWDIDVSKANNLRKGRDLGYAESILRLFGAQPTYKTANGWEGDGIVVEMPMPSPELLTPSIYSRSAASAVSKVVAVSATVPAHLVDETSFRNYLSTLDINGDSYTYGSQIAVQAKQIKQRDKELRAMGANYSLVDILIEWLNSHCYEHTGHWNYVADSEGVNGLLKISDAYNTLGVPLPYPEAAVRSTVKAITSDEEAPTVCFQYNTWIGTHHVFENIEKFHPNAKVVIEEMRAIIRENITEEMACTRAKVLQFLKSDGSFSYLIGETAANSSDMPVALPHTDEGDVNATFICMCGISSSIFQCLGYTYVPQYTESDMMRFICRLADQGSIVKSEYPTIVRSADFDNETIGNNSSEITLKAGSYNGSPTGSVVVVKDPRPDRDGNVLRMNSPNDGANTVDLDIHRGSNSNATRYFFEGEFCFDFPDEAYAYWNSESYDPSVHDPYQGYIAQLNIGAVKYNLYALGFSLSRENGDVDIFEYSSNNGKGAQSDLGFNPKIGEWFKIKIEYFVGNNDTVRIKVYFNDTLYAVSDNYFSPYADKYFGADDTQETYTGTFLNVMSYCHGLVYFDNLITYKDMEKYTVESDPKGELVFNVDAYNNIDRFYDFEGGELPDKLTLSEGNSSMSVENSALKIVGGSTGSIKIPINPKDLRSTALSFSADITYEMANDGSTLLLYATEREADAKVICYILKVEKIGTEQYAVLYEAATGSAGTRLGEIKFPIGETHNLRLDYYKKEAKVLIYIDDILLGVSETLCSSAHKLTANNFVIENTTAAYSTVYIDNLGVNTYNKNYANESAPPVKEEVFDFSAGISDKLSVSANAQIVDQRLELSGASSLTIPVNVRDTIGSTVIFDADILLAEGDTPQSFLIELKNAAGDTVIAYKLQSNASGFALYEQADGKSFTNPLATLPYDESINLRIEYYRNRTDIQLFVNGEYIGESSILYIPEISDTACVAAVVRTASGKIAIEKIKVEAYNKTYKNLGMVDKGDSDTSGTIGFEGSTTSDIPSRIIPELVSPGSKLRVVSAIKNGILSKALSFETNAGGGDIIYLKAADIPASYKKVVFEGSFKFNYDNLLGGAPFQLYLGNDSGAWAYMVQVTCVNNRLNLQALTGAGDVEVPGRISGTTRQTSVKEGQWLTLRIEYYLMSDGTARIITYVNGTLLEDTDLYYTKSTKQTNYAREEITRFRVQAYGSTDATVCIDDVSFNYSNSSYVAPEIPEPEPPTTDEILQEKGVVVLPVKGGANGIVTLIHDDGYYSTGFILDELLRKYGLVADVAMVVSNVYDVNTGYAKPDRLQWQKLIDTGRWKIINHSMTHGFWGSYETGADGKPVADSLVVDEDTLIREVITSAEILRELFPGQRVLTFAYPGHQGLETTFGEDMYVSIRKLVESNYIAGRYFQKTSQTFYDWEWDFMPAESIGVGYLQTTLNTIDAAATGKIATIFVHNVVTDEDYEARNLGQYGNSYTPISHMEAVMEKIAEHTESGAVWNTHYEDAVLYLREAEAATVTVKNTDKSLTVNLTHTLDSAVYNYALTVRAVVSSEWQAVKITQGTEVSYAYVKTVDGVTYVDMDLVPNAGMAHVAPIDPSEIPAGDGPGAGWGEDITVDSDILDFDNDSGSGTLDNSAWS